MHIKKYADSGTRTNSFPRLLLTRVQLPGLIKKYADSGTRTNLVSSNSLGETNYVSSSPTIGIFLYVAKAVERVQGIASQTNYVCSSSTIGIFLYVAQAVDRVLAVPLGNKICWFELHYQHISLRSPGS